jgi:hypothetical protein
MGGKENEEKSYNWMTNCSHYPGGLILVCYSASLPLVDEILMYVVGWLVCWLVSMFAGRRVSYDT